MAVLTRKNIKLFAVNSASNQTGEIGTYKLGSAGVVFSKDPDVIQSGEWENGMANTLQSDYAPFLEEYNSLAYTLSYFAKQQSQQGILKYDALEEYVVGSFAVSSVDGFLYKSLQGTVGTPNIGNEPSVSPTYWQLQDFTQKVNLTGDNATLSSLSITAKENIVSLGMPDYTAGVDIKSALTTAPYTWTAPCDGIIKAFTAGNTTWNINYGTSTTKDQTGKSDNLLFINGEAYIFLTSYLPISKGETIATSERNGDTIFFYPYKGVI